jgi:hypothetical protein
VLEPEDTFVGTLNEDFAIESNAGDIFQLGNASWQITQVVGGTVRVRDAQGAPPTIPFWLGEAPARSDELSRAVSIPADSTNARRACDSPRMRSSASRRVARRRPACALAARSRPPAICLKDVRRLASFRRRRPSSSSASSISRRDAAGPACAVRQPHQQSVDAGVAEALLPSVQLRAAGGRH